MHRSTHGTRAHVKAKERYRHRVYKLGLHVQMLSLQMQPGNYTTYAYRFSEIASQLRGLNHEHLMYMFLNGRGL